MQACGLPTTSKIMRRLGGIGTVVFELFLGEVVDFDGRDGAALGFHTSGFTAIADAQLGIEDLI